MNALIYYIMLFVFFALGFLLGRYQRGKTKYDGTLEISEKDSSKIHQLEIDTDPDDLRKQKKVTFRVRQRKEEEVPPEE